MDNNLKSEGVLDDQACVQLYMTARVKVECGGEEAEAGKRSEDQKPGSIGYSEAKNTLHFVAL